MKIGDLVKVKALNMYFLPPGEKVEIVHITTDETNPKFSIARVYSTYLYGYAEFLISDLEKL